MKKHRSAKSGKFVSKTEASANPETTVSESVKPKTKETELSAVMQYFEFCELNEVGTEEAFEGLNEIEQSTVLQICRRTLKAAGEKL